MTSPDADIAGARATSEQTLLAGAERWMRDALDAWIDDDHAKVALMAPMAVELLGKAALWRENPVLLVQLTDRHEGALFLLATRPDLAAQGVKTIGLQIVLSRLVKLLGDLPIAKDRQTRMVEVRNGAVHVGASEQSRFVLLDCLAVVGVLLDRLQIQRAEFLAPHLGTVEVLLDERKTEVSRQVATKMAKARARLTRLEETLGDAAFEIATNELEDQRWTLDSDDFVAGGASVEVRCPECGCLAQLFGEVDADLDYDFESIDDDGVDVVPVPTWRIALGPRTFFCMVCNLQLHGPHELAEAGLHSRYFEITRGDLNSDFDLDAHIQSIRYGH